MQNALPEELFVEGLEAEAMEGEQALDPSVGEFLVDGAIGRQVGDFEHEDPLWLDYPLWST